MKSSWNGNSLTDQIRTAAADSPGELLRDQFQPSWEISINVYLHLVPSLIFYSIGLRQPTKTLESSLPRCVYDPKGKYSRYRLESLVDVIDIN